MRVAEVMSRGIDTVAPDATVQEAATLMAEFDVGAVLVGDENNLLGILTDRDIILRVVVEGRSPAEATVQEVMSKTLHTCREDDRVEAAVAEMRERQIRRLPVLDETGKTVGIVTMSDLAKGFDGPEQMQEAIRRLLEPHRSREAPEKEAPEEQETASTASEVASAADTAKSAAKGG